MATFLDRLDGKPERTFANPFTSWHYRALPRPAYLSDVDGVEIESTYPVVLYEVKTIKQSLFNDIMTGKDRFQVSVMEDFYSCINLWQLRSLSRLLRPGLTTGLFVVTPPNAARFHIRSFDAAIEAVTFGTFEYASRDAVKMVSEVPGRDPNRPLFPNNNGCSQLASVFYAPEQCAKWLLATRRKLALAWAEAERDASDECEL